MNEAGWKSDWAGDGGWARRSRAAAAVAGAGSASKGGAELARHDDLLDRNAQGLLTPVERIELERLRHESDLFMLRKAHAAALLRWRGHAAASP
ncbi:hypothetical protein [Sorangium sp. So ce1099]|uniref:hypothetical protein n=1 Tax=Sorangium sp. So ce1099 TaxID=3133331 RepID=UPI003F624FD1